MGKIKAFIDANIWYSASNKSTGHSRQLLSGILPNIELTTSIPALEEAVKNLSEEAPNRIYVLESLIKGLGSELKTLSHPGNKLISESLSQVKDHRDAIILGSAKEANTDYLVTWNTKDFIQDKISDIKIVTPAELVKILASEET